MQGTTVAPTPTNAVVKGAVGSPADSQARDLRVVPDQLDVSPFEQVNAVPADITPSPPQQRQHNGSQQQQQQQQQHKQGRRKQPGLFARIFCCAAAAKEDVSQPSTESSLPGRNSRAPTPLQTLRSHNSWARMFSLRSRASSEYYDARSTASDLSYQLSHGTDLADQDPHWIPKTPLAFAPPGMKFVPVPAVTGFAGKYDIIPERSDPHPQPIDVMVNASTLVKKIHASVPGITIEEDGNFIKMIATPSFLPKGLPSAVVEVYDKTHKTSPSFFPRRDVKLGTSHGEVFFTDDGQLVLRHWMMGIMARKPDFVVEDYMRMEGNGIVVDRMCAQCCKTGKRAEQIQVVKLVQLPNGQPV